MKRLCVWIILSLAAILIVAFALVAQGTHSWGYSGATGPDHWSEFSATCGLGKSQSPIDIVHPEKKQLPAIEFAYHSSPLKVINNGHTIQVNYAPGSSITVEGKTYKLVSSIFIT